MHLVRKRHILGGQSGVSIDTLSVDKTFDSRPRHNRRRAMSVRGKIVEDEIIIQTTYLFISFDCSLDFSIIICPHLYMLTTFSLPESKPFRDILTCRLSHADAGNSYCGNCGPQVRKCAKCMTEFAFTVKQSASELRVAFEVWQNFGCGEDPKDPIWISTTSLGLASPVPFQEGTIRAKYERG